MKSEVALLLLSSSCPSPLPTLCGLVKIVLGGSREEKIIYYSGGWPVILEGGIFACNTHGDRVIDVRPSQRELLLLILVCNPHRDRALHVHHS